MTFSSCKQKSYLSPKSHRWTYMLSIQAQDKVNIDGTAIQSISFPNIDDRVPLECQRLLVAAQQPDVGSLFSRPPG